jgi:AcrR family transcriptional regulator
MARVPSSTLERIETDGRTQRRLDSYDRAVDAVLDLIGEGVPSPTAQQVAERSGLSIRTVFRLTEDVESLHAAAIARQTERTAPLYVDVAADGPLGQRMAALVSNRGTIFEAIDPARSVAERLAVTSPRLAEGLALQHRVLRAQVAATFAPELSRLPKKRRRDVLNAADVASSWETWDQLRRTRRLSRRESERVMERLLGGVLTPRTRTRTRTSRTRTDTRTRTDR